VCFAIKEEAAAFRIRAEGKAEISILVTGMGRENSRRALYERLKQFTPEIVFTCGFAGGLDPALATGEVIFSTDDPGLRQKLLGAGAKPGTVHCAARIATTAMEKADLRRTTGADVVEMESEMIQNICREHKIPCATVRVISDTAGEDLPLDFNRLSKPDLNLDYGKLLWAVAKEPGKIPALLRLQRNSSLAARRLADVMDKVIRLR